uniref:Putative secreted peptide n=1 Tax=Anopheles braziliensis TaxID=58242 RepID=A0A2M3ZMM3_9DIPT
MPRLLLLVLLLPVITNVTCVLSLHCLPYMSPSQCLCYCLHCNLLKTLPPPPPPAVCSVTAKLCNCFA